MKATHSFRLIPVILICFAQAMSAQVINYPDSWGNHGFTLLTENRSALVINHSLTDFNLEEIIYDGAPAFAIKTPGIFLPNDEGAPDLPGTGRYIVIPAGSSVSYRIIASRTEVMKNVDIAPAPRIPLDTEDGPMIYQKDPKIYSRDAFYPENPVLLSEPALIRGIDVVMIGITPFGYNPVTQELIIYRDIQVEISFEGGNGQIGEDRLRSRWWDPVIKGAVLNANAIPEMNWQVSHNASRTPDYEYLIITPNNAAFLQWADSIKVWRTLQGIKTGIVTTTEIGGNTTTAIKNYINNAYNNWDVPPAAVLMLGDYSTGSEGVISYLYAHPAGYPNFASDNYFADVNGDNLPDIVFARITARNATELAVMVTKFLNYERNPPMSADFYNHPITALGWQTVRWFQICSETVGGYFRTKQGKNPVRINALYAGSPSTDPWSTATNTNTVVNYFGPNGLGYIPATPQELGGFTGGTSTDIVNAINSGSFFLQHRDHGYYGGWGEPAFGLSNISQLRNINNQLPFILSINCQTGAYHSSSECFAEKFHRYAYNGQNSGALGMIAPTEVSYSFVNDTYVWGIIDNMFPDFMPGYNTTFPSSFAMPAFGHAAGKYFLYQSSWPYNSSDKLVTYRLFHNHGDAFMPIYYNMPQDLTVSHSSLHINGEPYFTVTADEGSFIALTVDGSIVATATGAGTPVNIEVPPVSGQTMIITVTKQNYLRYSAGVLVASDGIIAAFKAEPRTLIFGNNVTFTDLSYGEINTWDWSFPGGNPDSYSGQNPPVIYYDTPGIYDVSLTVRNDSLIDTETRLGYITVTEIQYCASSGNASVEWISSVKFDAQVKTSASSGTAGYEDHTGFIFNLNPGSAYSLELIPGYQGTSRFEYYRIWIDFNNDGDFIDPNEEIFNVSKRKGAVTGTVNIPSGIEGTARMRVSMKRSGLPLPCELFTEGEVEDFSVAFSAPVVQVPVADFSANLTQINPGQTVQFADLTTNNPTLWSWLFPGGTPSSSTLQHPSVIYSNAGSYDVTLVAANAAGQDTMVKTSYIVVSDNQVINYCEPLAINNSTDYISSITVGSITHASGQGITGYVHYASPSFIFIPGQTYAVTLVPFNSSNRNFWKIWIDLNADGDFTDSGEALLTINNKKGTATGSITIPSTTAVSTRMRISMKTGGSQAPCDDNFNGEVEDYNVSINSEQDLLPTTQGNFSLRAYPNPARDELNLVTTGGYGPVAIRIYDAHGNLISFFETEKTSSEVDIRNYKPGLYIVIAGDGRQISTEKVIIK